MHAYYYMANDAYRGNQCLVYPSRPVISTENGNLRVASQGDITFQAGEGGGIQFQSSSGENMAVGEQGPQVL